MKWAEPGHCAPALTLKGCKAGAAAKSSLSTQNSKGQKSKYDFIACYSEQSLLCTVTHSVSVCDFHSD